MNFKRILSKNLSYASISSWKCL